MTSYRVIILCAGMGERLRPLTYATNKLLVKVGDRTIIERLLDSFIHSGVEIELFQLIIGFAGYKFRELLGSSREKIPIRFQENPLFDVTGAASSLYLASTSLTLSPCIVMEGDYILDQKLIAQLVNSSFENCILVDSTASKTRSNNVVMAYGVDSDLNYLQWPGPHIPSYPGHPCAGEALTIFKTSKDVSFHLAMILKDYLLEDGIARKEIIEPYNRLLKLEDFHWIPTQGAKWAEVDTLADLERAREMFV